MPQLHNWSGKEFFRNNRWFLILTLLFTILCAILALSVALGDEVLWANARRTPFWDNFFLHGTQLGEAPAFIAVLVLLLFMRFRYALTIPLLGLSVSLLSGFSKQLFAHPRPALYFREKGIFDLLAPLESIHLNGGANSFPSGHTMAGFALFSFLAFCWPRKKAVTGVLFFFLAMIVGLSRIYLLQHFAKDVSLGAFLGLGLGVVWYYVATKWQRKNWPWLDQSLFISVKDR